MSSYREQIETAIGAVRFRSPAEALWFGRRVTPELPRRVKNVLTPAQMRACVLTSLQDHLYKNFYCKAAALPSFDGQDQAASRARATEFAERLSAANSGVGYVEPGWELRALEPAGVEVDRGGFTMRVRPSDCQWPENAAPSPGLGVSVRLPKELVGRVPGYYVATSNTWFADDEWHNVVRLYWNVSGEGAVDLVRGITVRLNGAGVPFYLKVLTQLARVSRADAAVLYLHKRHYGEARGVLERIHYEIAPSLRAAVPALTKTLAPGLGLAEDPGNRLSFGEHRSYLLADSLIRANELGKTSSSDRLRVVVERFAEARIDLDRPYLNPDSEDMYHFEPGGHESRMTLRDVPGDGDRGAPAVPEGNGHATYLEAAAGIGHEICRAAKWSDGRCNWMGATADAAGRTGCAALGPQLYGGASGVAWFLADLHAATGDAGARATALGAIEQALAKIDGVPAQERVSLFEGWIGIALAAARVAVVLREPDLLGRAGDLLRRLEPAYDDVLQWDYLSGTAGGIAGLLMLAELLRDPSMIRAATRLGDATLEAATKNARHWSWHTINTPREVNLTGFSHGAAGIAYALLELFAVTQEPRYRQAAELAFEYERRWFAPGARNWPDLRGYPSRGLRRTDALPCGSVWCHGAPGIALSRLRAYGITGDDRAKAEALVALETTRTLTETALRMNTMNFSLCHGLAGNGEVLTLGARALGAEASDGAGLAADIAAAGIDRYGGAERPWPCGAAGPTPSLMTGLAGMGYFYLRLANPALPSVLLLEPEAALATATRACPVAAAEPAALA